MKYYAERGIACLPVTALHTIQHHDDVLLFSSEGSSLAVRRNSNCDVLCRWRIFHSQHVHGIASSVQQDDETGAVYQLIIWGGRLICHYVVTIQRGENESSPRLHVNTTSLKLLDDWITIAAALGEQSCSVLTAHNVLWKWEFNPDQRSSLTRIGHGPETLLCSGAMSCVKQDLILIASGTVFGEVIFWTCSRSSASSVWNTTIKRVFLGHKGSVFGIAISETVFYRAKPSRLLASCSDDRTIRIWDVTDGEKSPYRTDDHRMTNTGFSVGHEQNLELAVAWGHLSRIWGVHLHSETTNSNSKIILISRGEDGVCQFWHLDAAVLGSNGKIKDALKPIDHDRYHAGKNIWSLVVHSRCQQMNIYTGGADGQVVSRNSLITGGHGCKSIKFGDLLKTPTSTSAGSLKQYLVQSDGTIVASIKKGGLVLIDPLQGYKLTFLETMRCDDCTLCSNTMDGLILYCLADGSLCAYDLLRAQPLGKICSLQSQVTWLQIAYYEYDLQKRYTAYMVVNLHGNEQSKILKLSWREGSDSTASHVASLPAGFVATTSSYCPQQRMFFCGSRAGSLAVLSPASLESEPLHMSMTYHRLHSSDSITSVMILQDDSVCSPSTYLHILTTGRDGTFAIHKIDLSIRAHALQTLHRATPPFGPNIEGAYLQTSEAQDKNLVLYGFKSKDFVVWDETSQTQLMSVDCGGAHRNWNYSPREGSLGSFVWTKAGSFNHYSKSKIDHRILRTGGHGREMKALAVSKTPRPVSQNRAHACDLVATGSEDTDIRLSAYHPSCLSQISVLKHHMTGIQALKFSQCGNYLFSSGGAEEFLVWRLNNVPIIGVGTIVVANLPKTSEDEDARIMSFDVAETESNRIGTHVFTILMVYSNGKAKIFEFDGNNTDGIESFRLVQVLHIGAFCLTQAGILVDDDMPSVLIGGTDGCLRWADTNGATNAIITHKVHQSNISTMAATKLLSHVYLIATGGDDNSLGLSILGHDINGAIFRTCLVPKAHAAALTAAAIFKPEHALNGRPIYVVTGGNDQMLRLWRVRGLPQASVGTAQDENLLQPESVEVDKVCEYPVEVDKVCEYPVDVADASNIAIIGCPEYEGGELRLEVLVTGVGMESMHFVLSDKS